MREHMRLCKEVTAKMVFDLKVRLLTLKVHYETLWINKNKSPKRFV